MAALAAIPYQVSAQTLIDTNFNDNTAQGWVGYNSGANFGAAATNIVLTTSSANLQVLGSPTTSFGGVARIFDGTRPFTLAVGEIMTLTFDMQWVSSLPDNNGGFRFGLLAWNEDSPLTGGSDNGYYAQVRVGTGSSGASNGAALIKDSGGPTPPSFLAGSDTTALATITGYTGVAATATTYQAILTLNRLSATELQISGSFNGNSIGTVTDSTSPFFSFSSAFIGTGGVNPNFRIDNVEVVVVPEPSTAALLGLGFFALYLLRRRRAVSRS
ncbi:MAG: PEP-CTERM sorting domain-containing protein [Verrucomicrobiia bacterium]